MCDFVYDTKHGYMVSGILLKIWVYDTKMYDTKCKTDLKAIMKIFEKDFKNVLKNSIGK